ESKLYKILEGVGVPLVHWYGIESSYNVLVTDLLGPSVEDVFGFCNHKFSLKTVLMLGDQMISRVEAMHAKSYLHRDIKPENLALGLGRAATTLHLMDFGLARRYREPKTLVHIPYREGKPLTGTARFASLNTHLGMEQSRRDDLESVGYVLVYLGRGKLPWQGLKAGSKKEKYEKVTEKKIATPVQELCKHLAPEIGAFIDYCRRLRFEEDPDYNYLRQLLKEVFIRQGYEYDLVFDWTATASAICIRNAAEWKPWLSGSGFGWLVCTLTFRRPHKGSERDALGGGVLETAELSKLQRRTRGDPEREIGQPWTVGVGSAEQLMEQADVGDWPSVAYQLAHERAAVGAAALRRRLRAKDSRARQLLRRASGAVLVLMPYDLCVAYTKTGKLPGSGETAAELLVEQPRWMQPRPKKDQRFLIAGDAECPRCRREEAPSCAHRRGGKLPEGWYTVVQYPLGDSPHLLRKAVLRRKDWRCADLEAPKERFYALWHVEWDDVKGEVCESLADAERKFEQFREVYKVLGRKLSVTGVLVDSGFRELRFVGAREASVMNKFRDWWQRHQAAAAVARDVGETLLCKAAKAAQWDLVLWMLQQSEEDSMSLANQLEAEWQGVWEEHFWYSKLRSVQDLRELLDSIAQEGMYLSRPWLRGGAVVVPKGAELVSPQLAMLKEALALEQQAPLALEALRR
ncbi:unnamed protein product, partial [Effrenium voratum]